MKFHNGNFSNSDHSIMPLVPDCSSLGITSQKIDESLKSCSALTSPPLTLSGSITTLDSPVTMSTDAPTIVESTSTLPVPALFQPGRLLDQDETFDEVNSSSTLTATIEISFLAILLLLI